MLSTVTSLEILPKYNEYVFLSKSFVLNRYIFTLLTDKKLLFPS